ncbi:hypothetical protein B4100_0604 [Heyndrickxia coagulans]|uniref:Uncharacterized protein n=1 Tax=Heyndrickxia coagulans TaxID=1398 RepID=A0A150KF00_HEYCO|nr:hypothetical protein B4100_0604 [Heyndrickxia coagulans]KYC69480.1 hypothetical protein B4099_0698 [Heyndrickxia coagulans]
MQPQRELSFNAEANFADGALKNAKISLGKYGRNKTFPA